MSKVEFPSLVEIWSIDVGLNEIGAWTAIGVGFLLLEMLFYLW